MENYIALIRKDPDTSYGVDFPDFPGCVSGGETLDEALENAREALVLHVEGMLEDGQAVPSPSTVDAVIDDPHNRDALAVVVELPRIKGRAVRVNITLDEHLLRKIDTVTRNRSAFLTDAAEAELTRRQS
jgi:predicted RNase H-like HicB family nuclease